MAQVSAVDSLYEKLVNEEDARTCADIPDAACRETPGNFLLILAAHFFTKLGDAIADPKTVLAWVTSSVGAPAYIVGFLVPIRESGSLIPQLLIGGVIRRLPVRKWVWVSGSVLQALAVLGLGVVAATMTGAQAGWAILGLLVFFSLSRGFCSVASKDVTGKTIPKGKRGQLTGWAASAAGLVTLGVGATLLLPSVQRDSADTYVLLLITAAALWLIGAATYSFIREYAGETEGGRNGIREALQRLRILLEDKPFRNFVTVRALLMASALSAPFYVLLAQSQRGDGTALLGLFVLASGVASLVSAPVWGRFADRSSRNVMGAAALVTASCGVLVFAVDRFVPALASQIWFYPILYFVLSIAHSGVRVGRKTYVVDLGSGNRRTDYVAVSNTVIGVLLLVVGSVGALSPVITTGGVVLLLALMGMAGAALSRILPDVSH